MGFTARGTSLQAIGIPAPVTKKVLAAVPVKTMSELQSGIAQSSDANGVYYEWSNSNWDFGTHLCNIRLLYMLEETIPATPACSDNSPDSTAGLPQCGTLLEGQGDSLRVEIRGPSTADEGDRVILIASMVRDSYLYAWTQTGGDSLSLSGTSTDTTLSFEIPGNFIKSNTSTNTEVVFELNDATRIGYCNGTD